ncbi:MAG: T9SS type A sorting domain-containing protein [Ignavibacteria bacterium]|jgi:hypothetical protein|nr:T9SS type A sorting domain-containing protein [Ignavibacteria bacterium]MCU7513432.1 T9SS type A sorting domain-containing protein [Ignavibacteria bacterium]
MKKSLISVLLLVLAFVQSYPQTKESGLIGRNLLLYPEQLNGGKLNKSVADPGLYSAIYRPSRIIVDSTEKDTYSYDFFSNLISRLYEKLYNGKWVTSGIDSMTYDSKGNMLTYIGKTYSNDGSVTSTYKAAFTYDSNGKLLTAVMENQMAGYYIPGTRTTYTYDASGNLTVMLVESASFSGWTNNSRETYTYDSKGNMLTNLSEVWANNAWTNSFNETYTYDGLSSMLTFLRETWNGSAWEKLTLDTYTYNNGSLTASLEEQWLNGAWTNKSRLTYTYDNNGYLIGELKEQWGDGVWTASIKHVFTNDIDGNAVKGESFKRDTSGKWVPYATSMEFRYTGYSGKKEILPVGGSVVSVEYETPLVGVESAPVAVNDYSLSQNYPNPFNPSTTINYSLKKEGNVKLTVFDVLGKIAAVIVDEYKPAGSYSVKFDAGSLPSGIYIYRLEAGDFTAAQKFLLMK